MRFLHAADIHLDAQLKGLSFRDGAQPEIIARATRLALANLVSLAIREQVDFVLIAGDLFDREFSDVSSFHFAAMEFQRLQRAEIPVLLIRGNHDFLGEGSQRLLWPPNVHQFRGDQPETRLLFEGRLAVHGQSFPSRSVDADLTDHYPDAVSGAFNIGLLHTSLNGSAAHDTYAPTRPENLKLKGYNYWALGHVHAYRCEQDDGPAIVFPGCTQGRHINEPGEKGCVIVSVENDEICEIEFHALDVIRWSRLTVELQAEDGREELFDRVRDALAELRKESSERPLAVRINLTGHCAAHHWLVADDEGGEALRAQLELLAGEFSDVWIEQARVATAPPIDVEALRQREDLIGEILRDLNNLCTGVDPGLAVLAAEALKPLQDRAGPLLASSGLRPTDPEVLHGWLQQVEGLIVDALAETEARS